MENKEPCRICKRLGCYAHCQKAIDGKHKPNPKSGQFADGSDWVVDFTCTYCGVGGSTKINPVDICWE